MVLICITYLSCWDDKTVSGDLNPTFSITYSVDDSIDGLVPIDSNNYNTFDTVTVLENIGSLEKPGYNFTGWNTISNGSGIIYVPGATFTMGATNVVLYAQWTPIKTFKITYNGNGSDSGIIPIDSTSYNKGDTIIVIKNTGMLTKKGYTFIGWSSSIAGELVGNKLIMDTIDVVLYAQWSSNPTFTVTYDGNGNDSGAVPVDINNYESGSTVTVIGNVGSLKKTGYTFLGWSTTTNGVLISATFSIETANVILYAQWSSNSTFTVTYDGNGNDSGAVPVDINNYESGATVTVLGNTGTLIKSGSTFIGWSTTVDGDLIVAAFLMGAGDDTLYAQWSANPTYSVTYDGNGNTAGAVPEDINKYEESFVVTILGNSGNLEKTGYSFIGWSISQGGGGVLLGAGEDTTMAMGNADVKLWAQWDINKFTVTFEENGGSDVDSQVVAYNRYATDPTIPTKTGHTFAGWFTSQQFTTAFDFAGVTITADRTLYAKWTVNQYSIIYNSNGSTSGEVPATSNHDYNSVVSVSGNVNGLKRFGYQFLGWGTNSSNDSIITSFTMGTSNVDLYVKWSVIQKYKNMTLIHAKDSGFIMGSNSGNVDEKPIHSVKFTYDFYMDTTEVTQSGYESVMGHPTFGYVGFEAFWSKWGGDGDNHPACFIDWYDAVLYCNARSKEFGLDTVYMYSLITGTPGSGCTLENFSINLNKNGVRLPLEAEWEYACRGGTTGAYYWGAPLLPTDCAWYGENADDGIKEVAGKTPNSFGLYDMAGNVFEWCNDWYGNYSSEDQIDPTGPISGTERVQRSSYFLSDLADIRSATRYSGSEGSGKGFRVVLLGE